MTEKRPKTGRTGPIVIRIDFGREELCGQQIGKREQKDRESDFEEDEDYSFFSDPNSSVYCKSGLDMNSPSSPSGWSCFRQFYVSKSACPRNTKAHFW